MLGIMDIGSGLYGHLDLVGTEIGCSDGHPIPDTQDQTPMTGHPKCRNA